MANTQVSFPTKTSSPVWTVLGLLNLAVPVVLAAVICLRTAVNIPLTDDYDCIGYFMAAYARAHGFLTRLQMILTMQHVQYKLMFLHTVTALQYELTGHTDYRVLQYLGDLTIFLVVLILWMLLARSGRPFTQRLWLFTVPCYTYLGLRYYETINWAMSGLQNLAIIPCSLATIFFLTSESQFSFVWCMLLLVLSIGTSGNGFFVALIVLGHLLWQRRLRKAAIAFVVIAGMAGLYAYHYVVYSVAPPLPLHQALVSIAQFPFLFLGASAHRAITALPIGVVLVAGFLWLTWRGWYRACSGSFLAALFCIVTALAVTFTRYRVGAGVALSIRYVMYSLLLISLEYIGLLRLEAPREIGKDFRWRTGLALAGAACVLSCLYSDQGAYKLLHERKQELITHLILWERHPDRPVLAPDEELWAQGPEWIPIRWRFQNELAENIALGIYVPPYAATDPLPIRPHSSATRGIEDEPAPAPPPAAVKK